ncbi:MAG: HAD-IIB family hydrolase, partial [Oscillospiraceae bacterium]
MKTLYISDLDGTLLNNASQISEYTKNTLNSLIAKGMLFSVATARGASTIMQLFNGISLNLPIVTLTGAIIYDPVTNSFPVKNSISKTAIDQICDCLATLHLNAFMQVAEKDEINVFYHRLKGDFEKFYVKRRNDKGFFNFKQIESLKNATSFGEVVLISVINTKPVIDNLLPFLQSIPEISTITYREEGGSDNYYLEIFAKDVSKANAIKELKSLC